MFFLHERATNARYCVQSIPYQWEVLFLHELFYTFSMVAGIGGRSFYLRECTQILWPATLLDRVHHTTWIVTVEMCFRGQKL